MIHHHHDHQSLQSNLNLIMITEELLLSPLHILFIPMGILNTDPDHGIYVKTILLYFLRAPKHVL